MIRHEVDAWDTERQKKREKMEAIYQFSDGKVVKEDQIKQLLEAAIRPGETVAIEGDNQKQAVQLSKGLATVDLYTDAGTSGYLRIGDRRKT